jgi:phage/plasmid-like protein (TIGR03299 family)
MNTNAPRNTRGDIAKVGDTMTVTDAALRCAPWRAIATWVNHNRDDVSAADAITAAGLDWRVEHTPLTTTVLTPVGVTTVTLDDKVSTTRVNADGTAVPLGITSPTYTIVQNPDIADLVDGITYEAGATIDSAGMVRNGKRVVIAARMPETVMVGGQDAVDTFLVITNGHDGTHGLTCEVKHLRLQCTNGMTAWGRMAGITLRHTSRMEARVDDIRRTLRIAYNEGTRFQHWADELLAQSVTNSEFDAIVRAAFPVDDDATDRTRRSVDRTRTAVWDIYRGDTQANIHGTAWGAYQAFVEYAEWAQPVRAAGVDRDVARGERFLLGGSQRVADRALAIIAS